MYKLKFTLKQHTPIIHFQHDQHGATLRASEVKPKLDRFIIDKMNNNKCDFSHWIIKGQENALNYKVKIFNSTDSKPEYYYFESKVPEDKMQNVQKEIITELNLPNLTVIPISPFFANIDKRNNKEYDKMAIGVFYENIIYIEFFIWDNDLKKQLLKYFPEFLCFENFGARQSKGFGCFTLANTVQSNFESSLKTNFKFVHKFKFKTKSIRDIFKNIENSYKLLKNKPPKESKIRDHFLNEEIEWEKKFISNKIAQDKVYKPDNEVMYVRALLGLAEIYDYQNLEGKPKVKIAHLNGDREKIERFQSPIKYKVFDNDIYLVANDQNIDEIKGERFKFYCGENIDDPIRSTNLQVPENFNLVNFLKEYVK